MSAAEWCIGVLHYGYSSIQVKFKIRNSADTYTKQILNITEMCTKARVKYMTLSWKVVKKGW